MPGGVSRRVALGAGISVVGAAAVAVSAAPAAASPTARLPFAATPSAGAPAAELAALAVRSDFSGLEGREFGSASAWSTHRLVLRAVADLEPAGADPEHAFRLEFDADDDARDGLYRLASPSGATHELFLSRAGGGAPLLVAIVNRR
jgi:hypothetical protein